MNALPSVIGEGRWRGITLVVAMALGQAAAAGVAAFATRDVFTAFGDTSAALPLYALVLVAGTGIAIALLRFGERVTAEKVGQNYAASLRLRLFAHLTRVSARDLASRRSGALSLRFVGDLAAVRGWVSLGLARMISSLVVLPVATGALFMMNPRLGIAAGIPIAVGLIVLVAAGPRLGPAHKRLRSRRARLAADMSERIPHAPELRLLGRVQTETRRMEDRTRKLIDAALERARGAALLRAIPDAVSGLAAASVFVVALRSAAPGAEAAGALAAVALMIQPMRDLAGVWDRHRAWRIAREKCASLLSVPKLTGADPAAARPLANQAQRLHFDDVTSGALSGFTATAQPGRRIALIGANGAGKSTLLSLAAGLELPASGSTTVGGRPATGLTARERRRLIALVGTRSPILAGSLRRALTMGADSRPDDDTVMAQAKAFGLSHVVERLGGLDGRVSEAGRNLSAGEIRRVLLARAALSRPGLLLLDEPDDALDQDGPALVGQLVQGCNATTLIVTHNLDIAAAMDEIWVIGNGRLIESGKPADGIIGRFIERRVDMAEVTPPVPA